jgi:hypothetical protein
MDCLFARYISTSVMNDDVYEVKEILRTRLVKGKRQFYMTWKSYRYPK